jgi:hypothetical protein
VARAVGRQLASRLPWKGFEEGVKAVTGFSWGSSGVWTGANVVSI